MNEKGVIVDAQDVAQRIASVLDTLCASEWHNGNQAQQQAIYDLDELYQELWRENPGIPERWWIANGKHPAYVWEGVQVYHPDECPHCKKLLAPLGFRQDVLMCPDCEYRTLK